MVEVAPTTQSQPVGQGQEIPVRLRGKFTPDETLLSTEIRRKLWEGQIALKIDLALDDQISLEKPRSLYVSARLSLMYTLTVAVCLDRSWRREKTTCSTF